MRLIDADALECISYTGAPDGYDNTFDSGVLWMLDTVDEIPTVDPARRGKWETDRQIAGKPVWSCSECTHQTLEKTPYCPMCGAKME